MYTTSVQTSERGREILIVDGGKFTFAKVLKSEESFWRCQVRTCKAKVWTVGPEKLISRCELEHTHSKNLKALNRQIGKLSLPHYSRPLSCGPTSDTAMSENQESRAERIARYKEQRRGQLAAQNLNNERQSQTSRKFTKDGNSSGSEGPRTTRASRLRAAAAAATAAQDVTSKEKISSGPDSPVITSRLEKDKSSKRKSNLNRSLNSEEVPICDSDDMNARRRRKRYFPPDVLQQCLYPVSNEDNTKSDTSHTARNISPLSSPITASSMRSSPRKSELSIHMENARKGLSPHSEPSKYRLSPRRPIASSQRDKSKLPSSDVDLDCNNLNREINGNAIVSNKENIKRKNVEIKKSSISRKEAVANNDDRSETHPRNSNISKRMDELTILTHETLARVEKLANKSRDSNHKVSTSRTKPSITKEKIVVKNKPETCSQVITDPIKPHTASILKKKSLEESTSEPTNAILNSSVPVSILKRKIFQDEYKAGSLCSTHSPPVTFSPSVVEPSSTKRKQGILKKRRSLDESQVLRHRSCSPDGANRKSDSRSILKNQRRSSLEEITRTLSPDLHLQGILKRKTSRCEDDPENSLNSPQSILKRRSGASSAGSTTGTQHVSIATAVILAAAGGAEIILEPNDHVKPILKKKCSEDNSYVDNCNEALKPILKKKSSTDTDDSEEKPKKPILKVSKNFMSNRDSCEPDMSRSFSTYKYNYQTANDSGSECEVKPILKQATINDDQPRLKLSFCDAKLNTLTSDNGVTTRRPRNRRSGTVCTDFNIGKTINTERETDHELRRPRPLSVLDLVKNFEKSTGAIPKRPNLKRMNDRSRTHPVTFDEIEASLSYVQNPQREDYTNVYNNAQSLVNLSPRVKNELGILPTEKDHISACKMSSDSAFQSLGDGLELEDENSPPTSIKVLRERLDPTKMQMKSIAEEARKMRLAKGNSTTKRFKTSSERSNTQRALTQPITCDEVQEAANLGKVADSDKDEESSKLSLAEKIKMFNVKPYEDNSSKSGLPKRRQPRFYTRVISSEEVEFARKASQPDNPYQNILDHDTNSSAVEEKRGILKSKQDFSDSVKLPDVSKPRSVLKKSHTFSSSPRSILKPESADVTYDEGISSNDSSSESDATGIIGENESTHKNKRIKDNIGARLASINAKEVIRASDKSCSDTHTSDESSGGREIQRIIGIEAIGKRQSIKSNEKLCKSKSQAVCNDEKNQSIGVRRSMTQSGMPSIGQIQAKLQQSGDTDWRKRIPKNNNASAELNLLNVKNLYNEELSERSSILSTKKDELDAASKQWKARVEKSDAVNFSVAGRMQDKDYPIIPINIPVPNKNAKPVPKVYRGKTDGDSSKDSVSTPVSPDARNNIDFKRSISVPGYNTNEDTSGSDNSLRSSGRKVKVLKPDDETFKSFYKSTNVSETSETVDLSIDDFDEVTRETLLVQRKTVKVQKRRGASKNPIKALASRSDIVEEYTEVLTGVAEREKKRLNIQKLSKNSNLAIEALAGLASKEDFSAVALRKGGSSNSASLPYKNLMLIHIKGRRHVQSRLVQPIADSINEGDCYVLITPNELYHYIGQFSNIIEQSRACDIVNHIQRTGDMGCKVDKVITINPKIGTTSRDSEKFWKLLGASSDTCVTKAGHPDEDEVYEQSILRTNMVYGLENNELVPIDKYWGKIPKIDMLNPSKVLVFDFGTEMYVWTGKTTPIEERRLVLKLAKELWSEGYNYSDFSFCPIDIAQLLGVCHNSKSVVKSDKRPDWGIFAKITQHGETILFREKFLDWPDYSRVIKVKENDNAKSDSNFVINPCNVEKMRHSCYSDPDFVIEGTHLGRGNKYFDEETSRNFEIINLEVTSFRVLENTYEQVPEECVGHFFDAETFVIRWNFRVNITGRELSGKPSKHKETGRDRCVYFCWLGNNASISEKGAAALLTIELDNENARQVRVTQGTEPTAFIRIFNGKMVIHSGKYDKDISKVTKLYMLRGEVEEETVLMEVPCSMRSLRSRGSFVLFNSESEKIVLWHGCKSSDQTRDVIKQLSRNIIKNKSFNGVNFTDNMELEQLEEGHENESFLEALGEKRDLYMNLTGSSRKYDYTPRLFHFSSVSGCFNATEILCPFRSLYTTSYPFLQSDLYSASQPGLFLFDNRHELWLWQGWFPEQDGNIELDANGPGALRWQLERKAAMQTVIDYWKYENEDCKSVPAYLVWAGLEPLTFTNLFPAWHDRDDIAERNIKEGKKAGEAILVEKELTQLTRTTYPLDQLLQRPLPEGVDPTQLEIYLSPEEFFDLLSMTKSEFQTLPSWKQTAIKKEKGLF